MSAATTAAAPSSFWGITASFLPLLLTSLVVLAVIVILLVVLLRKKGASAAFEPSAEFPHKTLIYIDGMTCNHCTATVQSAFAAKGYKVRMNLEEKLAEILSKQPINQADASTTIQNLGFTPVKISVIC